MIIPDYITHYYLADRQPFLSLSELNLEKLDISTKINTMSKPQKTTTAFLFPEIQLLEKIH